jgi:UDP-glucose 4-epimerase
MKILVTGGAGFIGSNVTDAYIEAGHEVVVVDNLYTGKRENLHPEAKFYLMDIRAQEMHKLLEYEKPEVINHHAAQISVPASVEDPGFDASVNIEGFINLLEHARLYSYPQAGPSMERPKSIQRLRAILRNPCPLMV